MNSTFGHYWNKLSMQQNWPEYCIPESRNELGMPILFHTQFIPEKCPCRKNLDECNYINFIEKILIYHNVIPASPQSHTKCLMP